jgi:hypothetical protein
MLEIGRVQLDDHMPVRCIVADPVDKAASGDVVAREGLEVHGSAIFYVDGFSVRPGSAGQVDQEYR